MNSRLEPGKLSVEFREGITKTEPIVPRRYTLTHSDVTAELFLTIGREFAKDKIEKVRDEVLGEWVEQENGYNFHIYLYIDGGIGLGPAVLRNLIFRKELTLALEAIRYGDRRFFQAHFRLNKAPIIIFFLSKDEKYQKVENWGTFSEYDISK